MSQKVIKIINPLGLHARPAAKIVECAGRFSSDIWLQYNDKEIDAKSIMSVLMLAAPVGAELGCGLRGVMNHLLVTHWNSFSQQALANWNKSQIPSAVWT